MRVPAARPGFKCRWLGFYSPIAYSPVPQAE